MSPFDLVIDGARAQSIAMPRWLTTLFGILLFLVLVQPNPAQAGATVGNAFDSLVTFFKSAASEVTTFDDTATTYSSTTTGSGQVSHYPATGPATGDGTWGDGDDVDPWALGAGVAGAAGLAAPLVVLGRRRRFPAGVKLVGLAFGLVLASGCAAPAAVRPVAVEEPLTASSGAPALPASTPVSLRIPAIHVDTSLVGLGLQADKTMAVPQSAQRAGWYRHAPTPGETGPAVITGHVDWQHEVGVFHDLRKLKQGDELTVARRDGRTAVFEVERVGQYAKSAFPAREVYGDVHRPELRLITCGGELDRATHNYQDNVVVFARMVRSA
jgi:LPXTG-site transpeptidase (sortase) family protein